MIGRKGQKTVEDAAPLDVVGDELRFWLYVREEGNLLYHVTRSFRDYEAAESAAKQYAHVGDVRVDREYRRTVFEANRVVP